MTLFAHMPSHVLQQGDEVECPRCGQWHIARPMSPSGHAYADAMLFIDCGGSTFYVGNIGKTSRFSARPSTLRH